MIHNIRRSTIRKTAKNKSFLLRAFTFYFIPCDQILLFRLMKREALVCLIVAHHHHNVSINKMFDQKQNA